MGRLCENRYTDHDSKVIAFSALIQGINQKRDRPTMGHQQPGPRDLAEFARSSNGTKVAIGMA